MSILDNPVDYIATVVVGTLLVFFWYRRSQANHGLSVQDHKLPPGPKGMPILGNVLMMSAAFHLSLRDLWTKYGDIYSCYFGSFLNIVVSDVPTIKTLLADERCSDRPDLFLFRVTDKHKGLGLANGHLWREQRRFALSTLRDLGMGKTWLQDTVLDEIGETISILKKTAGKPFNPKILIGQTAANVICGAVFGQRFKHEDEKFLHLMDLFVENNLLAGFNRPMQIFPGLRLIPFSPFRRDYLALVKNIDELHSYIGILIEQHRNKKDERDNKDYVDAFLDAQHRERDNPKTTFDDEQLVISVRTLFGGGTDTTAGTLTWALVNMVEYPEIRRKVQEEIGKVAGSSQYVTLEHKAELPFTEATIMEVQRMSPAIPATGRGVTDDIILPSGYCIPKGSQLVVNMYAVHHDPRYFSDPEVFNPSRFITPEGKVLRPDAFMPFASGKRMCLGESLARMQLFLIFANILKYFDIAAAPGTVISSRDVVYGQVNVPANFELSFKLRSGF